MVSKATDIQQLQAWLTEIERIASIGHWEWDLVKRHLSWSPGSYALFGLDPGAPESNQYHNFIRALHNEDRLLVRQAVIDALNSHSIYAIDYRIKRYDNQHERILHAHAETVYDDKSGRALRMVGTIQDVTARRRGLQRQELLQAAVDQATETIVITDIRANIIYVNPAFTTTTGYQPDEAIGQNPRLLQSGNPPPETFADMWQTLVRRKNWRGHFINRKKDGSLYEEEVSISPLVNHEQRITHYIAVKRDVSGELLLRRQLQQAQKLEAVGTLAGGIAHDFNNILTIITGNLELALMFELEDAHPSRNGINKSLEAAYRARDLVAQMLTFSRRQSDPDELQPLRCTPIIKEVAKLIRTSLPANIKINLNLNARADLILGAPGPLHQILINICNNAAQAMSSQDGELTIETDNPAPNPGGACEECLIIRISDTGSGIPAQYQERIFDPYFSTKNTGDGAGLGLASVHALVDKLGGEINFVSSEGRGTTFTIALPIIKNRAGDQDRFSDFLKLPTGCEDLLLVDDESEILAINQQTLEKLGYRVTSCRNGVEALKIFKQNPGHFDLVLTDIAMPKMTGDTMAREMLKIRPDLPIIAGTGYSESYSRADAEAMGIKEYYQKPLSTDRLAHLVRKVLNGQNP